MKKSEIAHIRLYITHTYDQRQKSRVIALSQKCPKSREWKTTQICEHSFLNISPIKASPVEKKQLHNKMQTEFEVTLSH